MFSNFLGIKKSVLPVGCIRRCRVRRHSLLEEKIMPSGGYDIGASLATASTSGANIDSPFNVTGGGGSIGIGAPAPTKAQSYTHLILIVGATVIVVVAMMLLIRR